ncbi:MAG: CpsB/CapC family capsule biosynthesis tyrosine phosphatase [Chitinophagaceae bacterium]
MFSIFRKKKFAAPDLSGIVTDMHSHLLPGIDDGSQDLETSVMLIRGMMELGYKNLITTPHIMWDIYQNTNEIVRSAHTRLQDELTKLRISIPVSPAAEYFLDDHFVKLLEDNTPLLTIKDNWVLIEFSFITVPLDLSETLFKMQLKGYQPVVAHPERYMYLRDNKKFYDTLKNSGCLFQLNLLSLANNYGKAPAELAAYLIQKNYIDLLGSDIHSQRHLDILLNAGHIMGTVQKLLDSGNIRNDSLLGS